MLRVSSLCLAAALILVSAPALAVGHDIDCKDCHSVHGAKGSFLFAVAPLQAQTATGGKLAPDQIDALCLGCHNPQHGATNVDLKNSHPTSVTPKAVKVPDKLLRKGQLTCIGCHDPHPSNANYKYLVVDTKNGKNMGVFCGVCHAAQSDKDVLAGAAKATLSTDPKPVHTPGATPAPAKAEEKPAPKPGAPAPAAKTN